METVISANTQRRKGLDLVVEALTKSDTPLQTLFTELQDSLYPDMLILGRGVVSAKTARQFVETIASERRELQGRGIGPGLGFASEIIASDRDYLGENPEELRSWFGEAQVYHFVDPKTNAYNPSFAIALFPEETITMPDRFDLVDRYKNPRYPRNYEHVKTLLISCKGSFYLVAVPGGHRVDISQLGEKLGLGSKQIRSIQLANYIDSHEIVGRERGAISPLITQRCFSNITGVLFAEDLLDPYSQPHYGFPIDKRSELVVSDTNDLIYVLRSLEGYPEIQNYTNKSK